MPTFNNPGNLKIGQGFAGETGKTYGNNFAVFDSPEMGLRALIRDLRTKVDRHGGDVGRLMAEYAPRTENPASYATFIRSQVGDTVDTPEKFDQLVRGIIRFENKPKTASKYLNDSVFNTAMELSRIDMPSGTGRSDVQNYRATPRPRPDFTIEDLISSINDNIGIK